MPKSRYVQGVSLALLSIAVLLTTPSTAAAALPGCAHFYTGPIPDRPVSGGHGNGQVAPAYNVSDRLPPPSGVTGGLGTDGRVTFTFNRVPGAAAYRAFRNGQALQWISDWGQPTLTVTDASPCQGAHYQVYAMRTDDSSAASAGQLSTSYRLNSSSQLASFALAAGTTFSSRVSAYNDVAQTASGYNAGTGVCAVDARIIPWGTRFYVPGYGHCYAADIGSWIKDDIVDVWFPPGPAADNWGIQGLTIVVE